MSNPNLSKHLHRYFQFDNAVEQPTITREGNVVTIPAFIEEEQREDGGVSFSFVPAKVPFRGQDLTARYLRQFNQLFVRVELAWPFVAFIAVRLC